MAQRLEPREVERVAVIGAGTIGASWAALFLARGLAVSVYDPAPDCEAGVRAAVAQAWPSLERLGLAGNGDPARVTFHRDAAAAVADAQFVQESVPERIDVKHAIYRAIEPRLAPETVVASSASGLLVSDMQRALQHPERFLLAHPFNPPHLIPLVELLGSARTDPAVVDWAAGFFARCGKETIRVRKEVPGHVANRLQAALYREAVHLVLDGVASVADVDKAIVQGPGLRWAVMGPHMLFNLGSGGAGYEVFYQRYGESLKRWWADLGMPAYTPEDAGVLAEGLRAEAAGRSDRSLAAERDEKLVALLEVLQPAPRPKR